MKMPPPAELSVLPTRALIEPTAAFVLPLTATSTFPVPAVLSEKPVAKRNLPLPVTPVPDATMTLPLVAGAVLVENTIAPEEPPLAPTPVSTDIAPVPPPVEPDVPELRTM